MKSEHGIAAIAHQTYMHDINELRNSAQRMDWEVIAKAASLMHASKHVITVGIGKSAIMAQRCTSTLNSIGKTSMFLHPIEALHGDIGVISSDDVVIIFSNSGNTEEIVSLMPYLKLRSSSIIGILGNSDSLLAPHCTVVIDASIERESCPINTVPSSSLLIVTAITNAMIASLMGYSQFSQDDFSKYHPAGQLGRNVLLSVQSVMISGNESLPFVRPETPLKELIIVMSSKGLGCAIVSDDAMHIDGFITDGDVRRCLQNNEDISNIFSQDLMSSNPVIVRSSAMLGEALSLMEDRTHKIGVLPVVNEHERCVGIIRLHDIAGHVR